MSNYQEILQNNNLKATHQRIAILEAIDHAGHIDVDKLFKNLRKHFPTLALGTMYRNLSEMSDKHILLEVTLPGQKVKYELKKEPHIHLVCNGCGKIEDRTLDIEDKIKECEEENDFTVLDSNIVFTGLCQKCQDQKKV